MNGNFSALTAQRAVVRPSNATEAKQLVKMAHDQGYRWENNPPTKTFYSDIPNICYRIGSNGIIMFKNESFYREHGYKVISFVTFIGNVTVAPPTVVEQPRQVNTSFGAVTVNEGFIRLP